MSQEFEPLIAPEIWKLRPDFVALSILVRDGRNAPSADDGAGTNAGIPPQPAWAAAHAEDWRRAYEAFGAKPKRTPCSVEALRQRAERDRALPRINAIVDLYNSVSLRYAVPIGGENLAAYVGVPRLVRAEGGEPFETVRDGQPVVEQVDAGEVVWRDDAGVTCRRWNWRQTPRTRLEVTTTDMWFVLERLGAMPLAELHEAGAALIRGVSALAPGARLSSCLIAAPGRCSSPSA